MTETDTNTKNERSETNRYYYYSAENFWRKGKMHEIIK